MTLCTLYLLTLLQMEILYNVSRFDSYESLNVLIVLFSQHKQSCISFTAKHFKFSLKIVFFLMLFCIQHSNKFSSICCNEQ